MWIQRCGCGASGGRGGGGYCGRRCPDPEILGAFAPYLEQSLNKAVHVARNMFPYTISILSPEPVCKNMLLSPCREPSSVLIFPLEL